jgi:hypothetical protein
MLISTALGLILLSTLFAEKENEACSNYRGLARQTG